MAQKIEVELGVKVGSSTAAVETLAAKIKEGLAPLERFEKAGKNLAHSFKPAMEAVGGITEALLAATGAAALLGEGMRRAMEKGSELHALQAQTGIDPAQAMVLQQGFKLSGLDPGDVGKEVNKMQQALQGFNDDGDPTSNMFARLHLNMQKLQQENPTTQMKQIGEAINNLGSPTQRTAAAMAIFGKEGAKMLALFENSGTLDKAATQVGSQADIMKQDAALFAEIADDLSLVGLKLQGFFVGMADQMAGVIEPMMEFFESTDFAAEGQAFGHGLAAAITALTDGSIWAIYGQSAIVAMEDAINVLWRGMGAVVGMAGQLVIELVKNVVKEFEILCTPGFWKGMGEELLSWVDRFNQLFYACFAGIVDLLKPLLEKVGLGGAATRMSESLYTSSGQAGAAADAHQRAASAALAPAGDEVADRWKAMFTNTLSAGLKFYNGAGDLLNTSSSKAQLEELVNAAYDKSQDATAEAKAKQLDSKGKNGGTTNNLQPLEKMSSYITTAIGGYGVFEKNILASDPMLSEAQRQTTLLEKIHAAVSNPKPIQINLSENFAP